MRKSGAESGEGDAERGRHNTPQADTVDQVLADVYDLLELYGPNWYSEPLHERIHSVLSHSGNHGGNV
jgi:hypothetical protein